MSKMISDKESLIAALPYSLVRDDGKEKLAGVIAEGLADTVSQLECAAIFSSVDKLTEKVLDILAVDLKIQWYESDSSLENKRKTVKECIRIHKYKGTKYAVEAALRSVYDEVKVVEWNEYGGEPYHFKVIIYDSSNDQEKRKRVLAKVQYYKNLRSILEETVYEIGISTDISMRAAFRPCGMHKRIYCEVKSYG